MKQKILSFLCREWLSFCLLLVSLFPTVVLGMLADVVSMQLFCMEEKKMLDMPQLSKTVDHYFSGHLGLMFMTGLCFWLLGNIWFVICACKCKHSQDFRLRFLTGFLILACIYSGLAGMMALAWALPYMPLCVRI